MSRNFAIPQIVVTMFLLIGAEVVGVTFAFTYRDNVSNFLLYFFSYSNELKIRLLEFWLQMAQESRSCETIAPVI